ncbi:MAG: hypothetical protein SOI15_05335 [Bifidobacterium crudilactis]
MDDVAGRSHNKSVMAANQSPTPNHSVSISEVVKGKHDLLTPNRGANDKTSHPAGHVRAHQRQSSED